MRRVPLQIIEDSEISVHIRAVFNYEKGNREINDLLNSTSKNKNKRKSGLSYAQFNDDASESEDEEELLTSTEEEISSEESSCENKRRLSRRLIKKGKKTEPAAEKPVDPEEERRAGKMLFSLTKKKESEPALRNYFEATEGDKTSDNTLSKLPYLNDADIQKYAVLDNHLLSKGRLLKKLNQGRKQMKFELLNNFNLCFYGYGSKKEFIDAFIKEELSFIDTLVINGYVPTLSIKEILNSICRSIVHIDLTYSNPIDYCEIICKFLEKNNRRFCLALHNIDGSALRNENSQLILSKLASSPFIYFITSMDHINTPFLWDFSKCTSFNFIYHDITTFEPYVVEASYENSILTKHKEINVNGAKHVLASLPENSKKIFKVLLNFQLSNSDATLAYPSYYAACRDEFLVQNEITFKSLLTEFKDHKLISIKNDKYSIPLDANSLLQLKSFFEDEEN